MLTIKPHERRKNHISVMYQGIEVAKGIDFKNGFYEVRPLPRHFDPIDRTFKVFNRERLEEFCERASYRHYGRRERFK